MRSTVRRMYLNAKEAADYTGYSVHFIRDAARAGGLRSYRTGRFKHYRFRRDDLDAWMESRAETGQRGPRAAS